MEDKFKQNLLYDFYGDLLTEHQKKIYEDAVFEDLSLSEIADEYGISRQGVHDLIKRCDRILIGYEEKLKLAERFLEIKDKTRRINEIAGLGIVTKEAAEEIRLLSEEIMELL